MRKESIYCKYIKRLLDIIVIFPVVLLLFPFYVLFSVIGFFAMKGNPFFFQARPGKNEKIFNMIKFRTMSNAKDSKGNLLPDSERLNAYGKFLRSTSIDELPELLNILKGDMSLVGPRPLSVVYLKYYNAKERERHLVLPGLTGLAQINGRNIANWPERFAYDIEYVNNVSFGLDVSIILNTVIKVLKRKDVDPSGEQNILNFSEFRENEWKEKNKQR